ncbi:MAG: phage tail family protein [bacterium]|nr:phage tail family protein [bacterium]
MRTGFTFKGRHSSEFGMTMATKSRPILPEQRSSMIDLPGHDGSLDYAYMNDYGRAMYMNRTFTIVLHAAAQDIYELQQKIARVGAWLSGSGELLFDDLPEVIWEAAVKGSIDYAPELHGQKALLTVNFEVQPFSHATFGTDEGPQIGMDIPIGSDIPIGMDEVMIFTGSGNADLEVYNYGTAPVRPVIEVSDSSGKLSNGWSISCGEKTIVISAHSNAASLYRLDLEHYELKARLLSGTWMNVLGALSGQFFELAPGINTLRFSFNDNVNYSIKISYVPEFIYGADFGGDEDA